MKKQKQPFFVNKSEKKEKIYLQTLYDNVNTMSLFVSFPFPL